MIVSGLQSSMPSVQASVLLAVDVHGAGAADALAAGAAEGQRRIDLVLDPDQRVEDHRPAIVAVDVVGVDARVVRRRPGSSDRCGTAVFAAPAGFGQALPSVYLRVLGEGELGHGLRRLSVHVESGAGAVRGLKLVAGLQPDAGEVAIVELELRPVLGDPAAGHLVEIAQALGAERNAAAFRAGGLRAVRNSREPPSAATL